MTPSFNFANTFSFSEVHKERVGQLINYLALKVGNLYCTKLIKLLYIIDEESIHSSGTPLSWLTYKVYQMGPVPEQLWYSIKDGNSIFDDYFDVNEEKGGYNEKGGIQYRITAISKEEMSEFSRREVKIIDSVISVFGGKTPDQLIEYLHREESLWYKMVSENEISFEKSLATPHIIDLSQLISNDKFKLDIYHDAAEEINLLETLS